MRCCKKAVNDSGGVQRALCARRYIWLQNDGADTLAAVARGKGKSGGKRKGVEAGDSGAPTVSNRQARYRYEIEDTLEAGVQLLGTEVKSIRDGNANLADSYVRFRGSEAFLVGCHIGAYEGASHFNHEPRRVRKLLLHRRELDKLAGRVREKGLTIVCTKLYFKDGRVKAQIGMARGKKTHDKRAVIRERQVKKEMDRAIKQHR
jgi:SsrA-binding protein